MIGFATAGENIAFDIKDFGRTTIIYYGMHGVLMDWVLLAVCWRNLQE